MAEPSQLRMPFEIADEEAPSLPASTRRELVEVVARLLLRVLQQQIDGPVQEEDDHDDG